MAKGCFNRGLHRRSLRRKAVGIETGSGQRVHQADVHHASILHKVAIGREDLPVMPNRHRAHQHVNWRSRHTIAATLITDAGSFLIIALVHWSIWEVAQMIANPTELRLVSNPRQHFLPCWTKELYLPLFD